MRAVCSARSKERSSGLWIRRPGRSLAETRPFMRRHEAAFPHVRDLRARAGGSTFDLSGYVGTSLAMVDGHDSDLARDGVASRSGRAASAPTELKWPAEAHPCLSSSTVASVGPPTVPEAPTPRSRATANCP